jgi:hypothetical protein
MRAMARNLDDETLKDDIFLFAQPARLMAFNGSARPACTCLLSSFFGFIFLFHGYELEIILKGIPLE